MKACGKQYLLGAVIVLVAGAVQSGAPRGDFSQLGDFLRNIDGTVKIYINQNQAIDLCKAEGKRLPTARELAAEGVKHGAKILELSQVSPGVRPEGFELLNVVNVDDGSKDQFYYNYENYVRPLGDPGSYWAWSSSVHAGGSEGFARGMRGYDGSFGLAYSDGSASHTTARCMSDF